MLHKRNADKADCLIEVRLIRADEPVDEAGVLLSLESLLIPLLKKISSEKKQLKTGSKDKKTSSAAEISKTASNTEIYGFPVKSYKNSA